MRSNASYNDPWMQTLGLLALLSGVANVHARSLSDAAELADRRVPCIRDPSPSASVVANITERPGLSTVTVTWCDATLCRYGDQIWHASVAKKSGVCALSGLEIKPGDAIYKPRPTRTPALNAGAMILSSVVPDDIQNCATAHDG